MMGPQPFHGHIGEGRIPPDQDSLLGGWQDGMGTVCDWESDAGRWSFRRAALHKKHDGEKTKPLDNQTGRMVQEAHDKDCIPRFAQEPWIVSKPVGLVSFRPADPPRSLSWLSPPPYQTDEIDQIDQTDQMNQIPATRHDMGAWNLTFLAER